MRPTSARRAIGNIGMRPAAFTVVTPARMSPCQGAAGRPLEAPNANAVAPCRCMRPCHPWRVPGSTGRYSRTSKLLPYQRRGSRATVVLGHARSLRPGRRSNRERRTGLGLQRQCAFTGVVRLAVQGRRSDDRAWLTSSASTMPPASIEPTWPRSNFSGSGERKLDEPDRERSNVLRGAHWSGSCVEICRKVGEPTGHARTQRLRRRYRGRRRRWGGGSAT